MRIALVLPIYNEEKKILDVLKILKSIKIPVILVNDGSTDRTYEITKKNLNKNALLISHKINLGKGSALKTGCDIAFGKGVEAVIFMDGDGQHSFDDLDKFITKLETKKYDIVFGSRNFSLGVPLIRFLGNKIGSVLISVLFKIYITDLLCGFRAVTKKAYEKSCWESRGYGIETEMVVKAAKYNLRTCEVPIETIYFDKNKGVTILDSISILIDVLRWRIIL